mgnify:CR=1 FL=1
MKTIGSSKGGFIRHPAAMKVGSGVSIAQPGNMAAQFGCCYAPRGGFFTAAFDGRGYPKQLLATRAKEGLECSWYRPCFASGTLEQDYDVALTTFAGASGALPPCDCDQRNMAVLRPLKLKSSVFPFIFTSGMGNASGSPYGARLSRTGPPG